MRPAMGQPGTNIGGRCSYWEEAMAGEKLNHVAVEQPRLLDLASVASSIKNLHFAAIDALLKSEGRRMCIVLAAR